MDWADEIAAWAENPEQIKLQLGELTAGELRTAQAVARMFAGQAKDALRKAKAEGFLSGFGETCPKTSELLQRCMKEANTDVAQLLAELAKWVTTRVNQIEKGEQ